MPARRVVAILCVVAGCTAEPAEPAGDGAPATSSVTGDASSSGDSTMGTVSLRFAVSNGVRMGPTLVDPLVGAVIGNVYLTSEVTLTGPREDAVVVSEVFVEGVDLVDDEVSEAAWTSGPIEPGAYTFLGMFDVDGNFEQTEHDPDPGDPVTLTNQKFEIAAGEQTEFTVTFELIYG